MFGAISDIKEHKTINLFTVKYMLANKPGYCMTVSWC